jgi:hypothetical protein
MIAGTLEIQMMADMARLKKDMDEAKGIVGAASDKISSAANFAKNALIGMAAGLSVRAFSGWIQGAIDAADASAKLSAKTGIAVQDLAGLQLAFNLGGAGGEAMATSMAQLSKRMTEGNDAFKQLGIQTRNADGSMRGIKDVLYSTADAFAGIKDGAAKSALAQELFGKAGAALIPVLNGGSAGMREMAEMAERLGLVISEDAAKQSEKFNDTVELLRMGVEGTSRQIATQMLPTLNDMAGGMLQLALDTDATRKASEFFGNILKGLYTLIVGGIEVFATFGKVVGGVGAALVALISGDFTAAKNIGAELMHDIKTDWTKTIANIGSVWDGTAAKTAEAGTKIVAAQRVMKIATNEQETATKGVASAEAKRAEEIAKLITKIESATEAARQETDAGQKLTAAQKEALDVMTKLRDGTLKLTEAETIRLVKAIESRIEQEEASAVAKEYTETLKGVAAHTAKMAEEQWKATEKVRDGVLALIEENEKLRIGESAWNDRKSAVALSTARDLEWQSANEGGNAALEEQARLLRQRASLMQEGIVLKEAKAAADEWKKTTDSINNGLTDALMRGFESGKSMAKAFKDMLINSFKTMVLKPTIQMIMSPVAGALGSLFGMMGPASAATGGAEMLGGGGLLGGLGGSLMAGAGWLTGEASLGSILSASGSLLGSGSGAGIMSGLGMGVGALGPIALGIGLLSALDKKKTPHVGGYALADASGGIADITAAQGGNRNDQSQAAVSALAGTVSAILNDVSGAFGNRAGVSVRGVFESDNNDPSWALFHLLDAAGAQMAGSFDALGTLAADSTTGFSQFAQQAAGGTMAALQQLGLPDWAMQEFGKLGSAASIDDIARVAGEIIDKAKNPAGSSSYADPLDAPLRAADPSPIWQEMADNAKTTAESVAEMLTKVSTSENQEAGIGALTEGLLRTISRLDMVVEKLTAMDSRAALQAARST